MSMSHTGALLWVTFLGRARKVTKDTCLKLFSNDSLCDLLKSAYFWLREIAFGSGLFPIHWAFIRMRSA